MNIIENQNLAKHTSFKVGGNCKFFVSPKNEFELTKAINFAKSENIPVFVLGNGSNVLVCDNGFNGLVIKTSNLSFIEDKKDYINIGCGTKMWEIGNFFKSQSLTGFEELSGIPGTFGGAIYMNAGAYGNEIANVVISVTYMNETGEIFEIDVKNINFGYRTSFFKEKKNFIILSAKLKKNLGNAEEIDKRMEFCKQSRAEKQPLEYPSAGSTFKRPPNHFAGKLIEDAGLKGFSVGGAKISDKHAGFVINYNNATAKDILNLINIVKNKVLEKFDVNLECEVEIIGE